MYLLLLVSNLLLWEHVASKPNVLVSTDDLYNRVVEQSHTTYVLAADIYCEFDLNFAKRSWLTTRMPTMCHTASVHTPENREEVHETKTEDLLKAIIKILHSWEEPLKHLVSAVAALPGASDSMLKRAIDVKERNQVLLEGITSILSKTLENLELVADKVAATLSKIKSEPGVEVKEYPAWSGLADLQSSVEDTRLFAFYNLVRCLRRDTHKADSYLKVLRCRVIFKNEC